MDLDVHIEVGGRSVGVRLGFLSVGGLRPHEEISYQNYREVFDQIVGSGVFTTPIAVDGASGVVLDGTHRLAVARTLGFRYVPAMIVDYYSRDVWLGVWAKLFRGDMGSAISVLREAGLRVIGDGLEGPVGCVLVGEDSRVSMVCPPDAFEDRFQGYRVAVKRLVRFFGEPSHIRDARPGRGEFAVVPPELSKADVVEAGLKRKLFPPKTTRHVFSARIVEAPIPVSLLKSGGQDVLDWELKSMLSRGAVSVLDGRTTYGGRYYEDEKIVVLGGPRQ